MSSRIAPFPLIALAALTAALGLAGARPAAAAAGDWLDHEQALVRLLAESDTAGDGETLRLGLQFQLQAGWKIYWRSPGDAGFPPTLDWSGSDNLARADLRWPVPHRFSLFGLETFGYADEVILPIEARVQRPGEAVNLRARVSYLICSEICVPHDDDLALDLPAGPPTSSPEGLFIEQAEALVPGDGAAVGLSLERAVLTGTTDAPVVQVMASSVSPFLAPDVLIEGPPGFGYGKPEVSLSDGGKRAVLRVKAEPGPLVEGVLEGKRITLTVTDGQRGLETEVIARYRQPPAAGPEFGLLVVLALALLGGLILNLMPCVLPVLSIKLLSVIRQGGRDRGEIRRSFLVTSAGIVFSFLILAGVAVALKSAGLAAGWGIQFQQPLFLTVMTLVVVLFALNLLGVYEIALPSWASGLAGGGVGSGRHSLSGDFLTGAFATLLATPCSAPFLGTAVGFALAGGPAEILLIFAALGFGLALPYLLVAAVPALAARLPRPGHWMVTLRRVLGLVLIATALWLLSVVAAQVGLTAAVVAGALLAAMGLSLGLRHGLRRPAAAALVSALGLAAVLAPAGFAAPERPAATDATVGEWEPLDIGRIDALVAEGKVVFVDITADWCITCKVNKSLSIDREAVARRLAGESIVAMRGDWTLPSEEISAYLASFGRYGIPFNAVYGPAAPSGVALPELLSVDIVLRALDRASG